MKITNTKTNAREIHKSFTIDIGKGVEIRICKWAVDDQLIDNYDGGWEFPYAKDQAIYDALPEAKQDKITDFIEDISLFD